MLSNDVLIPCARVESFPHDPVSVVLKQEKGGGHHCVVGSFGPIHSDLDAVTSERNSGMEAIQNSLFVGLPSPPTRMLVHKKLDAFG